MKPTLTNFGNRTVKLHFSPTSPYVRKALVTAHETGQADKIEKLANSPWEENALSSDNPIGKVPALVLDDGTALFDSRVICEYLDATGGESALFPSGPERWAVLRTAAMGDGIMEAGVAIANERRQDEAHWSDWYIDRQKEKIARTVDALESEADGLQGAPDIGTITVACALGYIEFRDYIGDWRLGRPKLAAWYETFAQRPSMRATEPKA